MEVNGCIWSKIIYSNVVDSKGAWNSHCSFLYVDHYVSGGYCAHYVVDVVPAYVEGSFKDHECNENGNQGIEYWKSHP